MLSLHIITPLVILLVNMTTAKHVREGRRRLPKDSDMQEQYALHSTPSSHYGSNRNAALIASLLDALGGDDNIQIIINANSGNTETTTNNDNSNSKSFVLCYVVCL